jgi:nickel/cobalt transporter (NicO) family protein
MEMTLLIAGAAGLGFIHTIVGPDHYVPFVVMARARGWSMAKTVAITIACGLGHVGSSVVLALAGIALGTAVTRVAHIESLRGTAAAWLLIAFGFCYAVWGFWRGVRVRSHRHRHDHLSVGHEHEHSHVDEHVHVHLEGTRASITPWVLFAIFVFGPCEPLIPMFFYPAARGNAAGAVPVTLAFGAATILTMLVTVTLSVYGMRRLPFGRLERFSHGLAGIAILLCGLGIVFLGL